MNNKVKSSSSFAVIILAISSLILTAIFFIVIGEITLDQIYKNDFKNSLKIVEKFNSPFIFTFYPNTQQIVGGKQASFNNLAFRRNSETEVEQANFRIISYGDSINFGYLVSDGEDYPNKLESLFKTDQQKIEVINTARGSSPSIYAFHLQEDLPKLKPNLVLLEIELSNDLGDESLIRFAKRDSNGFPESLTSARYVVDFSTRAQLATLPVNIPPITRSKLFYVAEQRFGNLANKIWPSDLLETNKYLFNLGFDRWLITESSYKNAFESMFDTIASIQNFAKENNADFLLILLPSKTALESKPESNFALKLIEEAELKAKNRQINYISLYQDFKNQDLEHSFLDFCHPSAAGHDLIARRLKNYIETNYLPSIQTLVQVKTNHN